MARLAASHNKTGQSCTTHLVSRLIVEHFTSESNFILDGAFLFIDEHSTGRCGLIAKSCTPRLLAHSEILGGLDPTQISRALGITGCRTEVVPLTTRELNCWLPRDCGLPEPCSALFFHLGTRCSSEAVLLLLKADFFTDEERMRIAEVVSACGEALVAKLEYDRMQRKSEEAASLISVINAINSAIDPQHLFQLIIEKAVEMIPHVDGAAVVTFDGDGRGYHLRAGYGYYKNLIEQNKTDFDIPEKMKESGAPFRISPTLEDPEARLAHVLGTRGEVVAAAEPLAASREHDHVHPGVEVGPLHRVCELDGGVGGDRVALLGPVEDDPCDPAVTLVGEGAVVATGVGRRRHLGVRRAGAGVCVGPPRCGAAVLVTGHCRSPSTCAWVPGTARPDPSGPRRAPPVREPAPVPATRSADERDPDPGAGQGGLASRAYQ